MKKMHKSIKVTGLDKICSEQTENMKQQICSKTQPALIMESEYWEGGCFRETIHVGLSETQINALKVLANHHIDYDHQEVYRFFESRVCQYLWQKAIESKENNIQFYELECLNCPINSKYKLGRESLWDD